jgi:hypothetical protein
MTLAEIEELGYKGYIWGWALANMAKRAENAALVTLDGRQQKLVQGTPVGYGEVVMQTTFVMPKERVICCPSHNLIYGSGAIHLNGSPVVIQVPEFKDRYWVYCCYDGRTNEFAKIGKQYNTKCGFHLLVGPTWKSPTPAGIDAIWQSTTDLVYIIPRIYTDGTKKDLDDIQPLIQQVRTYSVKDFNPAVMVSKPWNPDEYDPLVLAGRGPEARFVKTDFFIEQLRGVINSVDPLPGEQDFYRDIMQVLAQVLVPITGVRVRRSFMQGINRAESTVVSQLMEWDRNGIPLDNRWYTSVNAANWITPSDSTYLARTATAKSNMFENRAEETKYYYTDTDSAGDYLDGSVQYTITFPKDQVLGDHVKGAFWSLTVYDHYHLFNTKNNPAGQYSLGTYDEPNLKNPDGSITIYVGGNQAPSGQEKRWLPTPLGEPFSLFVRAYGPDSFILSGKWKPPAVVK